MNGSSCDLIEPIECASAVGKEPDRSAEELTTAKAQRVKRYEDSPWAWAPTNCGARRRQRSIQSGRRRRR